VASLLVIGTGGPVLAKEKTSCDQIVAAMGEGNKSADDVAAQLDVNVKRVRKCMDPTAAKDTASGSSGCDKIVAAMEEENASADEVAMDLGVRTKRVRRCMKTAAANP
jgi:predicted ArsR family transcriptional regulator